MSPCGEFCQRGGKEGDFNPQERAQLAYRKNLLYVHSLRELTVNAVLPGIHNLLVDLRAPADSGWAGFCLPECADDFSSAGAARVFHLLRGRFPTQKFETGPGNLSRRLCRAGRAATGMYRH